MLKNEIKLKEKELFLKEKQSEKIKEDYLSFLNKIKVDINDFYLKYVPDFNDFFKLEIKYNEYMLAHENTFLINIKKKESRSFGELISIELSIEEEENSKGELIYSLIEKVNINILSIKNKQDREICKKTSKMVESTVFFIEKVDLMLNKARRLLEILLKKQDKYKESSRKYIKLKKEVEEYKNKEKELKIRKILNQVTQENIDKLIEEKKAESHDYDVNCNLFLISRVGDKIKIEKVLMSVSYMSRYSFKFSEKRINIKNLKENLKDIVLIKSGVLKNIKDLPFEINQEDKNGSGLKMDIDDLFNKLKIYINVDDF